MSTNKTMYFVLVAIASLVVATLTSTPASLNASTQDDESNVDTKNGNNNNDNRGNSNNNNNNEDDSDAAEVSSNDRDGDDRDDDGSPALTLTKESTNPSGSDVKEIQSDEHSERAAAKEILVVTSKVKEASTDDPALTINKVRVDKDGTVTEESKSSSEKSSIAGARVFWSIEQGEAE